MKVYVVYDDTVRKSELINDIIGNKGFSDVIVKRKRIEDYYHDVIKDTCAFDTEWKRISSVFEFKEMLSEAGSPQLDERRIIHCFSDFFFTDADAAVLSLEKIKYIRDTYKVVSDNRIAMIMFSDTDEYKRFLINADRLGDSVKAAEEIKKSFSIDGLSCMGYLENFIQIISGNFDSRFFNSIRGDNYTLTKSSVNKKKIKSEYTYYRLLPDTMKMWMVMPFDYRETEDIASYSMERLHMTDLAIKWVHGSINSDEFREILDKLFYFINSRSSKQVSREDYIKKSSLLYSDKVYSRIDELKKTKEFPQINSLLKSLNNIELDDIAERYFRLKDIIEGRVSFPSVSVIGHGDPCFANTMYNKATHTLKFIDPKGALSEEELWTNPYYDLAKISHSICGRYDFFNNALFEIKIRDDFHSELAIDFDNTAYKKMFREKLEKNGFDYLAVRVYELSLFLSMLPLHIDYPHKVFGFILNAIDIMDEIENEIRN